MHFNCKHGYGINGLTQIKAFKEKPAWATDKWL